MDRIEKHRSMNRAQGDLKCRRENDTSFYCEKNNINALVGPDSVHELLNLLKLVQFIELIEKMFNFEFNLLNY